MIRRLVVTVVLAAGLLAFPAPAMANDDVPCVDFPPHWSRC